MKNEADSVEALFIYFPMLVLRGSPVVFSVMKAVSEFGKTFVWEKACVYVMAAGPMRFVRILPMQGI